MPNANDDDLHFDRFQFAHCAMPIRHAEYTAEGFQVTEGLDWNDYSRMGVDSRALRNPMWTPPFAASTQKLRKVIVLRAQQYLYGGRGKAMPEKVDWQEVNQRATAKALARQISPSASAYQHQILATHKNSIRRFTYMGLQAAVAYRAWREGMNSVAIAETLGIAPWNVRQILYGLRKAAARLGFDTGAAHKTCGHKLGPRRPAKKIRQAGTSPKAIRRREKIAAGICGEGKCQNKRWGARPECKKHIEYYRALQRGPIRAPNQRQEKARLIRAGRARSVPVTQC